MTIAATILGAVIGGAVGFLVGRSPVCIRGQCEARHRLVPAIIACALLGAAAGHWLATR